MRMEAWVGRKEIFLDNGPPSHGRTLALQLYANDLSVLVAQIFGIVFPHLAEPQVLSCLRLDVFGLAIRIGKLEARVGQENSDAGRVLMHDRFFAAAVSYAD